MSFLRQRSAVRLAFCVRAFTVGAVLMALLVKVPARAALPEWLQHIVGASTIEAALYRTMSLPGVQAQYPRPPKEAAAELDKLVASAPDTSQLYEFRARAEEQALDETSAEHDWKLFVAHARDPIAARLELADFDQRRLLYPQAIATLKEVAAAPSPAEELYLDPPRQRSWITFERVLTMIDQQGMAASATAATFDAFITRYPDQPSVYAAAFQFELEQHDWNAASALLARYRRQLPHEDVFPVRAQAMLEFRRGNADAALAVYDKSFQPLWNTGLIQSYLALLDQTHRQRAFVAAARRQLAAHPDGPEALNALARIFYYDQQGGRTVAALQTLEAFRIAREARNGAWSAEDLDTLAQLSTVAGSYAEAARYNYALAATTGTLSSGEPAAQKGLASLVHILIQAPAEPLAVGAANLTMYRDIATLDQGPGYWNGILSLWLNSERPAAEYASETAKAQRYFERSKAADLLADLDKRFPAAPERVALHAELVQAIVQYGQPSAVITEGKQFLTDFASAPERLDVADAMADAYAQQNDTQDEFALYESQLSELAAKTGGMPLSAALTAPPPPPEPGTAEFEVGVQPPDSVDANADTALQVPSQMLASPPERKTLPEATAYARLLDRYIGRLTATGQLPLALTVLRQQLDRNPNDPLLYERLSTFLQQNNLSAEQEQVFELAIAKFQQPGYYDKLARFYLQASRSSAFAKLTRQVTDIFSGTDLDAFFANVTPGKPVGPQLALELNLYAAKRFPHDEVFTRNLLTAYRSPVTRDTAAYEALLRRQWWVSSDLRDEFFAYLSRTGKLQAELSQLQAASVSSTGAGADPAAIREQAELDIFTSHFEQAAPMMGSVAALYPADTDVGDRTVSLFRSLAYLDPTSASTEHAVAVEKNLLEAAPDNPDRLATLGDLYAEATSSGGEDLASAEPYWHRIPELHPGSSQGFLTSATIFWDYFQFDDAVAEIDHARTRFHSTVLFGYEAGALAENRNDLQHAIAEYTNAVIHPLDVHRHFDSGVGVIQAWLSPPSDAADSNLQSTAQSFFGSEASHARLMQLSTRAATRKAVDDASLRAVTDNPSNLAALKLRSDVLAAQHPPPELTPLLTALFNHGLDQASTLDAAQAVGELAQARGLTAVYERSLARQAELTPDPVGKIQLQYTLARSMESRNDIPDARRVIVAVYTSNPRLLGVVRSTTDFYDRIADPQHAIATLLDASRVAIPSLAHDFTLEAAGRANQAGDTAQARTLALALLQETPYDARVLAIVADSYARVHDDAGLKQFYLARLSTAAKANGLGADTRKQDIALLRRGLIPALERLHDYPGVIDQYIALLSAYPEDANTGQEAALFALQHSTQPRLLAFLRTTVTQSPHDSRFMVLLAQVEQTFDDLPAAELAYSLAIGIRKDRSDLYMARADIETRLSQTDPSQSELAATDFQRLYLLSYHDPAWMVRLAELRARQGRASDAVNALTTAYITGHKESADDSFTVAGKLADWNLLPEARTFAEHGVTLSGADLLTSSQPFSYSEFPSGAVTYARILTRLGMAEQALTVLIGARKAADVSADSPTVLAAALEKEGLAGDDADAFRKSFAEHRKQIADQNLRAAIGALGAAVQTWYTPEQKQSLAQALDTLHDPQQPHANPQLALQTATAAGLADREADWRRQALLTDPLPRNDEQAYATLQHSRLQFQDLAQTLEHYAARLAAKARRAPLLQAVQGYRDAGDIANEMRLTHGLVNAGESELRDRYFQLLLLHDRPGLQALAAGRSKDLAYAALNYTIAHGTEAQALTVASARAQAVSPLWHKGSAALIETYFAGSPSSVTSPADFTQALGSDATVADRLATHPDPAQHITGADFFFYSSRFGIFLAASPRAASSPDPEDFLAGELEGAPSSPAPYLDLARTYAEAKNIPAASAEYRHALELSPDDPAILDEFATMLYAANKHDEAQTQWSAALAKLRRMQQQAMYPEAWFTSLETITRHLGERHLTTAFRADLETILSPYFARNGDYRSNELLQGVYGASETPADGVSFLLTLANTAPDPDEILRGLDGAVWLDAEAQEAILVRRIELAHNSATNPSGESQRIYLKLKLVELYLDEDRIPQAQAIFDTVSSDDKRGQGAQDAIVLAVRSHHLQALLDAWSADSDAAPATTVLASAIASLQKKSTKYKPDPATIRPLQEFLFEQKDRTHIVSFTDFLSLAQVRIDTQDIPGALQLLQRLALLPNSADSMSAETTYADNGTQPSVDADVVPPPATSYTNIDHAAALLEHAHMASEAVPFLRSLVRLTPWEAAYRFRLASALLASDARDEARTNFLALARDATAPYDLRVHAARALASFAPDSGSDLGSAELSLIVHPTTAQAARQPYFTDALIATAATPALTATEQEALLREAIAIRPTGRDADRARIDLFLLQSNTANPSAALAILDSLQTSAPSSPTVDDVQTTDDTSQPTDDDSTADRGLANHSPDEIVVTTVALPPPARKLSAAASIQLALQLSSALERDGDTARAASYAQLAHALAEASGDPRQAATAQKLATLKTTLLQERCNAQRQPVFGQALTQAVQVRPRLSVADLQRQEAP